MDTNKYFGFSDLTNSFEINADSITTNIINASDINTGDLHVAGTVNIATLPVNSLIGTSANGDIVSKTISGTLNQITATSNIGGITLSTPQDIATTSNVTFNNIVSNGIITNSSLSTNSLVATDENKALINRILQGSASQINISTSGTTTTISTPQDISTVSNVTFNNITSNGAITNSTLSPNSIVATDGTKTLINRTLAGTANQINISTVGTTTTFTTPQNIHTGATPTFAGVITNSIESISNTLNIASNNTTQNINIGSGLGLQTVNIGSSGSGVTTINIGAGDDIVNIAGALNYISTNNLDISDNLITINKGSAGSGTARGAGLNIRDNSVDNQGYITVSNTGNSFTLKAPENNFILSTPVLTSNSNIVTTTEAQTIGGFKTFTGNIMINPTAGGADIGINASGQAGFNIYSFSAVDGLGVWSQTLNGPIFKLKNALTTNRLLTTDGDNFLATANYGPSDVVITSTNQTISGVKTFSGTINMTNLTASRHLALDASKNIITVTDPATNLLSTNNTWTGTNTFGNTVNLTGSTASRLLVTDAGKNVISASFGDSEIVRTTTGQTIGGIKTFTSNPVISPSAGGGVLTIRASGQSGFEIVTFSNADGIAIWNLATGGPILSLKYFLTPNRILTTDGDNFLASAAFGPSEIVRTTTNQTIAGEKTFSNGIRLPTVGGTASLLNFYEDLTIQMQFTGPFATNQFRDVYLCRVGKCVTFTVQDCVALSPAPAQGGEIITTGTAIPARFLGASKCVGTFRVLQGSGEELANAYILNDGRVRIILQPFRTFASNTSVGFGMFSCAWTV